MNLIKNKLINNEENILEINSYPNPSSKSITIEFLGKPDEIDLINIFNIKGEIINIPYSINPINSYLTRIVLDLNPLNLGTYFFSLTNSDGLKETITFIKN